MAALVLITRPLEQAKNLAAEIEAAGALPIIQPLLEIELYPVDFSLFSRPDAVVLTSAHAMEGRMFPSEWCCDVPVFCVGHRTEDSARAAGAQNIYTGSAGVEDMFSIIREKLQTGKKIFYLCGEHITQDLQEVLPDYTVERKVMYSAHAVSDFRADVMDVLPKIEVITLFSRRSAEILMAIMQKNNLIYATKNIKLLCMSSAVLESIQGGEWKSCHVASSPNLSAMIEKLKDLIQE